MLVALFKEMLQNVVVNKDASLIYKYFHEDFMMHSNGISLNFHDFFFLHEKLYATNISYTIAYDEPALFEQEGKIAGRVLGTVAIPGLPLQKIEVVLISHYLDDKLYRIWTLTHPDWSRMGAFQALPFT